MTRTNSTRRILLCIFLVSKSGIVYDGVWYLISSGFIWYFLLVVFFFIRHSVSRMVHCIMSWPSVVYFFSYMSKCRMKRLALIGIPLHKGKVGMFFFFSKSFEMLKISNKLTGIIIKK